MPKPRINDCSVAIYQPCIWVYNSYLLSLWHAWSLHVTKQVPREPAARKNTRNKDTIKGQYMNGTKSVSKARSSLNAATF